LSRESKRSPLLEIAHLLVRFNHIASLIENPDNGSIRPAEELRVVNCIRGCIGSAVPQTIEWQRIGD